MRKFITKEKWALMSILAMIVCLFTGTIGVLGAEVAVVAGGEPTPIPGAAGLSTQVPGAAATVSNLKEAGVQAGGEDLVQADIDEDIFLIGTDETVLDGIMRKAKKKQAVTGFEVDHYLIDEKKSYATSTAGYVAASAEQAAITVSSSDAKLFADYGTVIAKGVSGYSEDGQTELVGTDLMLFIVGKDSSNMPIVRAVNGPKSSANSDYCTLPAIPSGTKFIFLANACAETQKEVAPNMVTPVPTRMYLQKMIMNQLISDYFDKQKKRIPFQEATIAEAMVKQFRRECNRSLWISHKGKFKVNRGKMGDQFVYTTEGLRWQFKRQYDHTGVWTFEQIIALAKMKFTGQNCSTKAFWLMGKDQLESIQNIDFTKHKDITMTGSNVWGFECTQLHTVFGDFYLKHEPTLDYIGYGNSGGIIDLEGLVRYYMKNEEASEEKVEGEEAKRKCIISINALALKGTSHIWVNGNEGESAPTGVVSITSWSDATNAPTDTTKVYLLTVTCAGIADSAAGKVYEYKNSAWVEYTGTLYIDD